MKKYDTYEVPPRGCRIETDDELRIRIMGWIKNNNNNLRVGEEKWGERWGASRMAIPLQENEICVLKTQKEDVILNEEFYNDADKYEKELEKKYK